jgi:hypothetical protein
MPRRISPKPEPVSLPRRIGLWLKLIKTALGLLEAEGAKTLLCLPIMFLGAYLCLRGVEAGKIVLGGSLMVLLMRLRSRRLPGGSQVLVSALLRLFGKGRNPPA